MVLVRTNVTREVYERLQNGKTVEAITNFDKIGFQTPYEFLKEISDFDNFFFGIAANSYFHERIDDTCELSSEDNVIKLMLDIPREELASMNYYDFSDLIFYTECEIDDDIAERVKIDLYERLSTHHLSPLDRDLIQVIYPRIEPSYIIAAEERK